MIRYFQDELKRKRKASIEFSEIEDDLFEGDNSENFEEWYKKYYIKKISFLKSILKDLETKKTERIINPKIIQNATIPNVSLSELRFVIEEFNRKLKNSVNLEYRSEE